MAGTKAFAIKRALITQAKLLPALATLAAADAIWDSSYSGTARPKQVLWFGEILWASDQVAMVGRTPPSRDEEFNIRFGIEVNDDDDIQSDANAKVETIMQAVEVMAGNSRLMGVDGIITMGVVPIGLGEGPGGAEGNRAAFLAAQVNVKARK